jgi:ribosome-associated toxin RatA of RatAB toxin-antitoxin module
LPIALLPIALLPIALLPIVLLLAGWVTGAGAAAPPADAEDPAILARLEAGEVVARETSGDSQGGSARMQMLVRAPAQAVWAVIVSCELAFRFVDGLQRCEVLEDSGDRALVHQVVDRGWLTPRLDFVFESLRQPWDWISFRLVEGNVKAMEGSWRFEETPAGTLVEYEIRLRPQARVPGFLVRRNIGRTLPDLLACVRGLAGGSGTGELREQDLGRCAGPA